MSVRAARTLYPTDDATQGRRGVFIYEHTDGLIGHRLLARSWKLANDNNGNRYDPSQKKTTRRIPVVALSRTD